MQKPITLKITYEQYITILCALDAYREDRLNEEIKARALEVKELLQAQYLKQFA